MLLHDVKKGDQGKNHDCKCANSKNLEWDKKVKYPSSNLVWNGTVADCLRWTLIFPGRGISCGQWIVYY